MARHQIIYTSCMRGRDGVNDGQQIFSYDESFSDSKTDDIKGLFTYQVPSLPVGTLMTEELARMMPDSFMYRLLKNESAAVTLNTYLGRDYMGSTGRFGNHLSHSIVCDFSDFDIYPCEMYAGTALRRSMGFEEVNNPDPPAYLPVPELTRGYVIDPESISEFLEIGENMEYYKQMVAALLSFPVEKKRIVICDEPDNIVRWIAALHYTMPLDIAKRISFTTYEYDPELSPAQICGVISEGSRYNVAGYISSNRHYVFDFVNHQFSLIEADDILMEFLDTAFSFSYDSLTEFHDFVLQKTIYRECSTDYYAAYYLYNLFTESIAEVTQEQFGQIVNFAREFMTDGTRKELLDTLICGSEAINRLDNEYALRVLGYMLQYMGMIGREQQLIIKQMIVDRLILALSTEGISESSFILVYNSIDGMARDVKISIPAELMIARNRNSLLGVLEQQVELWKVLFLIRIIGEYVKDMHLSADKLYPDQDIGTIYYGIVRLAYAAGRRNGYEVVEHIIDSFKDDVDYYINISLNIEGFLRDLELGDSYLAHLWEYFYNTTVAMAPSDVEAVNQYLSEYERYDEMYQIYSRQIMKKSSLNDIREYFTNYWDKWFANDSGYRQMYAATALRDYENLYERKLTGVSDKELLRYATEILYLAMELQITEEYVNTLFEAVCEYIPLEKISADNLKMINDIYIYRTEVMQKPIEGRLLLLWIAIQFEKVKTKKEIVKTAQDIKSVEAENDGARLNGMTDGKIRDYFEWIFDSVNNFSLTVDEFTAIYEVFSYDRQTEKLFMEYWCSMTFKKSKGNRDYVDFGEFLTFMFEMGNLDDQDMVGKYLCKLGKQKLEDLDMAMKQFFNGNRKAALAWGNIKDIAISTNPLFNNLSGLFKRKKQ
ncbi:MAG: hypothetical protein HDR18_00030 [Lachnospiraceae bacterium]|nr:hypothetical protein [Lachnospiraceae bacterium]